MYKSLVNIVSKHTGRDSLVHLVKFMSVKLDAQFAFVTDAVNFPTTKFKTAMYWTGDSIADNFEYELEGTPCELIVRDKEPKFYPSNLGDIFPKEKEYGYESYHAVPLFDYKDNVIGHLGVADIKPMPVGEKSNREALLKLLAMKVQAELERSKNDEEKERYLKKIELQKQELQITNTELQTLNKEKNYFIKTLSHDIRAPFQQISGLTKLLELDENGLSDDQKDLINRIHEITDRSNSMISKILDIGFIESHEIKFSLETLDINAIVEELVKIYQIIADEKKIEIVLSLEHRSFPSIKLDKNYFYIILENLISNAVKFSSKRSEIRIGTIKNDKNIRLEISDSGPGITENDMSKIFQEFGPLTAKPTNGETSLGLGLSIAKKYTTAMGGKIWCENEKDRGATFVVEFAG